MVTQERLKELLSYNPITGDFTWLRNVGSRGVKGEIAGCSSSDGYVHITIDNCRVRAHRLAFLYMTGSFPEKHTDHINGIRNDNRWENLRSVTRGENLRNKRMSRFNTSGFNGVHWSKQAGKWNAQIKVNRKKIDLGTYSDLDKAIEARKCANIKYGFHQNHGVKS